MGELPDSETKAKGNTWCKIAAGIFGCALLVLVIAVAVYFGIQPPPPPPTPSPTPSQSAIRLPRSVLPRKYDLHLQTFFPVTDAEESAERNFTYTGKVAIDIESVEATKQITLHARALSINESSLSLVRRSNGQIIRFESPILSINETTDMVTFYLETPLVATEMYTLTIRFEGKLLDDLKGFYRTSYFSNGERRWLLITQFEPDFARKCFPCFDEPDMKATFLVSISHPKSTNAVSNMPMLTRVEMDSNYLTVFQETVLMSTYLLAFGVSDFSQMSSTKESDDLKLSVWCRDSQKIHSDFALRTTSIILDSYVKLFGQKYPLPKLDTFAVPDFENGAMENWGLITYREAYVLLDHKAKAVPLALKMRVANIIAHELAHQWFGNLVTMAWWDSLWLNEGFATYVSYDGAQIALPDWKDEMKVQFVIAEIQAAMTKDELPSSTPIHRIKAESNLELYFDYITYKKGASVIRMLNMLLLDHFYKGLQSYIAKNAYKNTEESDLWNAFQTAVDESTSPPIGWDQSGINVTTFMDKWVNIEGFPVVIVTRINDTHVQLTQQRFISDLYAEAKAASMSPKYQWYIPFWYASCVNENGFTWLQPNQSTLLELKPDCWFKGNIGVKSLIRVMYPLNQNPTDILTKEEIKKIPADDAAQMIDDAFNLAKSGYAPYNSSLDVQFAVLSEQTHDVPWKAAFAGYGFLRKMLTTSKDALSLLKNFIRSRVIQYDNKVWQWSTDYRQQAMNDFIIDNACFWQIEGCQNEALDRFKEYMDKCKESKAISSQCSPIAQSARTAVYCTAVSMDEQNINFDFIFRMCEKEEVNAERTRLISALACTRNSAKLYGMLKSSISRSSNCIKLQDVGQMYRSMSKNEASYPIMWTFLEKHWQQFVEKEMEMTLRTLVAESVVIFNTEKDLNTVNRFLQDPEVAKRNDFFRTLLAPVKVNKLWRDRYFDQVVDWLKAH